MSMPERMIVVALCVATSSCVIVQSAGLTSSGPPDERMAPTSSFPLRACPTGCSIDVSVVIGNPNTVKIGANDVFIKVPRGRHPEVTWQLDVPPPHEGAFGFDLEKGIDFGTNAASFSCPVKTKKVYKCRDNVPADAPPTIYKYTIRVVATAPQRDPEPLDPFYDIE